MLEWKDNLLNYGFSFFKWYADIIETRKVRSADYLVVESDVLRNKLVDEYGIDAGKVIVAHNAVDADEFQLNANHRSKVRASIAVKDDELLVGVLLGMMLLVRRVSATGQWGEVIVLPLMRT